MKTLLKLITAIIIVASIAINISNKTIASDNIQYVQCIVIDNKVQSCTDITDGKLVDTAKVNEAVK